MTDLIPVNVDAAGTELSLSKLYSEVSILYRNFSVGSAVCYTSINGPVSAASPGSGRVGIKQNGARSFTGALSSIGLRMDSGTCVAELMLTVKEIEPRGVNIPK